MKIKQQTVKIIKVITTIKVKFKGGSLRLINGHQMMNKINNKLNNNNSKINHIGILANKDMNL